MSFPEGIFTTSDKSSGSSLCFSDYPSKPPKCECWLHQCCVPELNFFRQIYPTAFPSQCLPVGNCLLVHSRRRKVLEASHYDQAGDHILPSLCSPANLFRLHQILLGIQDLLNDPNVNDPAQSDAYTMFK